MDSLIISRGKNCAMKNLGPIFVHLAPQNLHHNSILELQEFLELVSNRI